MRYRVFLSYCHADSREATWLQRRLEQFVPPAALRRRHDLSRTPLRPVFRDRTELGSSESLSAAIEAALAESECLVVLCSPAAARSIWVGREIERFRELRPGAPVFAAILSGTPPGGDDAGCFPAALLRGPDGEPVEPAAADFRREGDGRSDGLLRLIAGILGLGFDQFRRRAHARRQAQFAAFGIAGLAIASVTSILALLAVQARTEADQRRVQAEGLIEFMLGDLRERLTPIGRLDVLDAVGDEALAYFSVFEQDDADLVSLEKRGLALRQIGEVRNAQGRFAESREIFEQSRNLLSAAADRPRAPHTLRFELAMTHYWLATCHFQLLDYGAAEAELETFRDLLQDLVAARPDELLYVSELASAEHNIGVLRAGSGRYEEARARLLSALEQYEDAVERSDGDHAYRQYVATTLSWLGTVARATETVDAARDWHLRAQRERAAIFAEAPTPENQLLLARVENVLANDAYALGDLARARAWAAAAAEQLRAVHRHDPGNASWRREYLVTLNTEARLRLDDCVSDGVPERLDEVEAHLAEILRAAPEDRTVRRDGLVARGLRAQAHLLAERHEAAIETGLAAHAELGELASGDEVTLLVTARNALVIARALRARPDLAGRYESSEAVVRAVRAEVVAQPNRSLMLQAVAAGLLEVAGDHDGARPLRDELDRRGFDLESGLLSTQAASCAPERDRNRNASGRPVARTG